MATALEHLPVEPVITARRLVAAAAIVALIVVALIVGYQLGRPDAGMISRGDCVNPPGPGLYCAEP